MIKRTTIYSRMGSPSYFNTYDRTIPVRCGRCQLQNNRVATKRYVVLSKIITSASSTWHGIRQRYVDQNWLDHIAWQRRPAANRIYREILRVVKRFWTRHGKVGAQRHFCGPLLIFPTLRKSSRPSLADAVRAATDQVVLINFNWLILTKRLLRHRALHGMLLSSATSFSKCIRELEQSAAVCKIHGKFRWDNMKIHEIIFTLNRCNNN